MSVSLAGRDTWVPRWLAILGAAAAVAGLLTAVAIVLYSSGTVEIVDLTTGTPTLLGTSRSFGFLGITSVSFAPDRSFVIGGGEGTVEFYDVAEFVSEGEIEPIAAFPDEG